MNNAHNRFPEIDILRGIAIIGMIIFHLFFLLNYFAILQNDMYEGIFLILARGVQFLFLSLVGVSMAISFQKNKLLGFNKKDYYLKQWKRASIIFLFALIITLVTKIIIPDKYVFFGILHFIALSIVILSFIADNKWLSLMISISSYFIFFIIQNIYVTHKFLLIFGFKIEGIQSIDYFPIFPWISIISLGIFFGHTLYKSHKRIFTVNIPRFIITPFAFLGKKALIIYMIHVPILYLLIQFIYL